MNNETRTQNIGDQPGPKPSNLERKTHKIILLIESSIDEFQDLDP